MSAAGSLAGKRIVITRAAHQAGDLKQLLEAKGAETLLLPMIAIEPPASYAPLDAALGAAEGYAWLVLTSANAARVFGERMRALGIPPVRLASLRVACVGPSTARAAQEAGLKADLVPERYVAEGLVESFRSLELAQPAGPGQSSRLAETRRSLPPPPGALAGRKVLVVRAAAARDLVLEALRAMGAEVDVAEAYRTTLPAASAGRLRTLFGPGARPPDAVTFTSASTVANFFALLQAAGVGRPPEFAAISIGPITSRALRERGWEPAAEACPSHMAGLAAACERLLAR